MRTTPVTICFATRYTVGFNSSFSEPQFFLKDPHLIEYYFGEPVLIADVVQFDLLAPLPRFHFLRPGSFDISAHSVFLSFDYQAGDAGILK